MPNTSIGIGKKKKSEQINRNMIWLKKVLDIYQV